MTKKILFQDTSFRDGFQSIFGARALTKDLQRLLKYSALGRGGRS